MANPQYIFTMRDLRKVVPPSARSSRGSICRSFPAPRSASSAPMAPARHAAPHHGGRGPDFLGEARPMDGVRIGYLPQEPALDPAKDVRGNVEEAVQPIRALLTEFEEISAGFAEPMTDDEMNALLDKQGALQDRIEAADAWELDRTIDIAMDALRLPARRGRRDDAFGRREAPGRALPAAARAARHAAARRADQPSRRRIGGVAGALPEGVPGDGRRDHPRPLLPRQRRRSGSSSSTAARAFPGRGTTPPGSTRRRSGSRSRRSRPRRGSRRWSASSSGCGCRPEARQAKSKARHQRLRGRWCAEEREAQEGTAEILIPPRRRASATRS